MQCHTELSPHIQYFSWGCHSPGSVQESSPGQFGRIGQLLAQHSTAPPTVGPAVDTAPAECWGTVYIRPSAREGGGGVPDVAQPRMRLTQRDPLQKDARCRPDPVTAAPGCLPHRLGAQKPEGPPQFCEGRGECFLFVCFFQKRRLLNWPNWLADQSRVLMSPAREDLTMRLFMLIK